MYGRMLQPTESHRPGQVSESWAGPGVLARSQETRAHLHISAAKRRGRPGESYLRRNNRLERSMVATWVVGSDLEMTLRVKSCQPPCGQSQQEAQRQLPRVGSQATQCGWKAEGKRSFQETTTSSEVAPAKAWKSHKKSLLWRGTYDGFRAGEWAVAGLVRRVLSEGGLEQSPE